MATESVKLSSLTYSYTGNPSNEIPVVISSAMHWSDTGYCCPNAQVLGQWRMRGRRHAETIQSSRVNKWRRRYRAFFEEGCSSGDSDRSLRALTAYRQGSGMNIEVSIGTHAADN